MHPTKKNQNTKKMRMNIMVSNTTRREIMSKKTKGRPRMSKIQRMLSLTY